jgi:hypothetical protein
MRRPASRLLAWLRKGRMSGRGIFRRSCRIIIRVREDFPMHRRAAYALASALVLAASAALARLPPQVGIDRALDARPVKPVMQEHAAALMRLGCQDDWECWDRHGIVAVHISMTKSEPWKPEQQEVTQTWQSVPLDIRQSSVPLASQGIECVLRGSIEK